MLRYSYFLALLLLLSPLAGFAREAPDAVSPSFTTVPELSAGFDLLYQQKFAEAREGFASWESRNPEQPFGEVAVAASYLFEELSRQGVLTSDFFLNEKKFLHGIDCSPDAERMSHSRADPGRRNGSGRGIDSAEKASRRLEAHEKSQRLCEAIARAASRRHRRVHRPRHRKLHYRLTERRYPLHALVWWNSRRQKAWHGESRQDRRKRPLSPALRQNYPGPRRAP